MSTRERAVPNVTGRARRRARARGAAMLEGIIVITTMLVFLGLIVWTRKSYGMKLDLQQSTRSSVLYYASHGCTGNGSFEVGGSAPSGSPEAEAVAGKANVPNRTAASRTWNTANATNHGSSSWQAVWDVNAKDGAGGAIDLQKQTLTREITAASKVTCNEKKYANAWTAWFEFGVDFAARGLGGVGDLFR